MVSKRGKVRERILKVVNESDKPMTKTAIAKKLQVCTSTVCFQVDMLELLKQVEVDRVTETLHLVSKIK